MPKKIAIEMKSRGKDPKEAYKQLKYYENDKATVIGYDIFFSVAMTTGQKIFANLVVDVSLGAQNVVNELNKQSNNRGLEFSNWFSVGEGVNTLLASPYSAIDFGLYANQYKGNQGSLMWLSEEEKKRLFVTFCVEPETLAVPSGTAFGKLNYSVSSTRVAPSGVALTVGAAYLYTHMLPGIWLRILAWIRSGKPFDI